MEKKRVKLDICGVSCTLITEESEEYMHSLESELSQTMGELLSSMSVSNIQIAAVTTALSFLDERNKNAQKVIELESALAEKSQELANLEQSKKRVINVSGDIKNPMRNYYDETGLVSYYVSKSFFDDETED